MNNQLDLPERYHSQLLALIHEHVANLEIWAYGSRVNGRSYEGSDLDLVLRTSDLSQVPVTQQAAFVNALSDSTIPILIEARDWSRLPDSFHKEIEKNYVVIHRPTDF